MSKQRKLAWVMIIIALVIDLPLIIFVITPNPVPWQFIVFMLVNVAWFIIIEEAWNNRLITRGGPPS